MWSRLHAADDRLSEIAVAASRRGRVIVVGVGPGDGTIWRSEREFGRRWTSWATIATPPGLLARDVAVAAGRDERFGVACVDVVGQLWWCEETAAGSDAWSGWQRIGDGTTATSCAVAITPGGRVDVVVARAGPFATLGAVHRNAGATSWSAWSTLPYLGYNLTRPQLVVDGNDTHVVTLAEPQFALPVGPPVILHAARRGDQAAFDAWTIPAGAPPTTGSPVRAVSATALSRGGVAIAALTDDGAAWYVSTVEPTWRQLRLRDESIEVPWQPTRIRLASTSDGRVHLVAGTDQNRWQHAWSTPGSTATWSPWLPLFVPGDRLARLAVSAVIGSELVGVGIGPGNLQVWRATVWGHELRVHVIALEDDDGQRRSTVTATDAAHALEAAQRVFDSTGIRLVLDGFERRASTQLNRALGFNDHTRPTGNAIAATFPRRMVVLLRHGTGGERDPTGNGNAAPPPGVGPRRPDVPDVDQHYVSLPSVAHALGDTFVAHEVGHYLGLHHTHVGWGSGYPVYLVESPTRAQAEDAIRAYAIKAGKLRIEAFDGDGIDDTPPDPAAPLFESILGPGAGVSACGDAAKATVRIPIPRIGSVPPTSIDLNFAPDTRNVMSYYRGCPGAPGQPLKEFSPGQIVRMHQTLRHPQRKHLLGW